MGIQCSVLTSRDDVLLLLLGRDVKDVFLRRPQPFFVLLLLPLLADLMDALLVARVLLMPVPKKDGRRCVLLRCWQVAASPSPSLLALLPAFIVDDADDDDDDDFDLI